MLGFWSRGEVLGFWSRVMLVVELQALVGELLLQQGGEERAALEVLEGDAQRRLFLQV